MVGMINSIHLARWVEHLYKFKKVKIYLFPVFPVKAHPKLQKIISNNQNTSNIKLIKFIGWEKLNNLFFKVLNFFFKDYFSIKWLNYNINKLKPKYIHSHELTTASTLCLKSRLLYNKKFPKWIVTNWGSELVWLFKKKQHKNNLKKILNLSDFYSAECQRDFILAKKIGTKAKFLNCIINSGGIDIKNSLKLSKKYLTSSRKIILIKGYHGLFGLALNAIRTLESIYKDLKNYEIIIYSADKLIVNYCKNLNKKLNITIYPVKENLSSDFMYQLFSKSKIYIGLSKSDGISTSLLEAMALGAFPIQSNTSCAKEWIKNNKCGFIVDPSNINIIKKKISYALNNSEFIDIASKINRKIIEKKADAKKIRNKVREIYK